MPSLKKIYPGEWLSKTLRQAWMPLLFLLVLPPILFSLRGWGPQGGDTADVVARVYFPFYFYLHAPLVTAGHRALWLLLSPWGWTAAEAIALSSSVAGGVYLWGLYSISSNPRVWIVSLVSWSSFVFLGHVETYAWPFALTLWVLVFLRETTESEKSQWPMWLTLIIATFCHPIVLMMWPGVFWGLYPWDRARITGAVVSVIILGGLLDFFLFFTPSAGFWQEHWLLPFEHHTDHPSRYGFFSALHWWELFGFYARNMAIGSTLLVCFGWKQWRGWQGGLLLTAFITVLWSLFWQPGLGPADWDLFAWPAIFVNLAGGLAWARKSEGESRKPK